MKCSRAAAFSAWEGVGAKDMSGSVGGGRRVINPVGG